MVLDKFSSLATFLPIKPILDHEEESEMFFFSYIPYPAKVQLQIDDSV